MQPSPEERKVGAVLSDEQVGELLASQARCEEHQRRTSAELESVRASLTTVSGRLDDLVDLGTEIETVAKKTHALEEKQALDDDDRTRREERERTTSKWVKVAAAVLTVIVLPLAGWGAKWLLEDYGSTRTTATETAHDVATLEANEEIERRATAQTRARVDENRDDIRTIEGRLEGIENAQQETLQELRSLRVPRRRQ